jgi:hypothetical protein
LPIRKDEVYQHKRCHSWRIPVGILTDLNSVPFLEKASCKKRNIIQIFALLKLLVYWTLFKEYKSLKSDGETTQTFIAWAIPKVVNSCTGEEV